MSKPIYELHQKVFRSSTNVNTVNFSGRVVAVIKTKSIKEFLQLAKNDLTQSGLNKSGLNKCGFSNLKFLLDLIRSMKDRDKDYLHNPWYLVEPDTSPGVASYEEAKIVVPSLTREQYDFITKRRIFIAIESDLISIE